MEIHRVAPGETLTQIADRFGISVERLAEENGLSLSSPLVVGQALIILRPSQTYTVQAGDTPASVASRFGIPLNVLLQYNPSLARNQAVYPGQTLVIDYADDKLGTLSVAGYAYPNIDPDVLRQTLPYLTYLTIFSYGITAAGRLLRPDDDALIAAAREAGVAPLMLLSTLSESGQFNNALSTLVLTNDAIQTALIEEILTVLREKNYYGLDVDFEFVLPEERQAYVDFIARLTARLNAEGFPVMVALAPKTSAAQRGLLYESHDYAGIGAAANAVLLMTYEWGYTYGYVCYM